jgi:hypothetical protein
MPPRFRFKKTMPLGEFIIQIQAENFSSMEPAGLAVISMAPTGLAANSMEPTGLATSVPTTTPQFRPSKIHFDENDNDECKASNLVEVVPLPKMSSEEFITRFKSKIQCFVADIREFWKHQADMLEKQRLPIDESKAYEERIDYCCHLFTEIYKFEELMEGFDSEPMRDLLIFVNAHRIGSRKNNTKYHSRPKNMKRFCDCEDNVGFMTTQCVLRNLLSWCDLQHVEDVCTGSILWTGCSNKYYDPYDDTVEFPALVMIEQQEMYSCDSNIIILADLSNQYLSMKKYPSKDFMQIRIKKELKNDLVLNSRSLSTSSFHTTRSNMHTSTSKMISSLAELSAFYETDFKPYHLVMLSLLGSGSRSKNFLDLLLNGYLPEDIYRSMHFLAKKVRVGSNELTPDIVSSWLTKYGEKRTWTFVKELVFTYKHETYIKGANQPNSVYSYSNKQPIYKKMDYSLEEIKIAMDYWQYIHVSEKYNYLAKVPQDVPSEIKLEHNPKLEGIFSECKAYYDIHEVLIWCIRHGGDTSQIDANETLESWKSKTRS